MAKKRGVSIRTKVYSQFKGVDFSTDPSTVPDNCSPLATNMIADIGGYPEKRPGYRKITSFGTGKVNGIFSAEILIPAVSDIVTGSIPDDTYTCTIDAGKLYSVVPVTGTVETRIVEQGTGYAVKVYAGAIKKEGPTMSLASAITYIRSTYGVTFTQVSQFHEGGYYAKFNLNLTNPERHFLAHVGTKLYRWHEDGTEASQLLIGLPDQESSSVFLNNRLWIFTGDGIFYYTGHMAGKIEDIAYTPTTIIGRTPSGGGQTYEAINYVSSAQTIGIMGDGTSKKYYLPYTLSPMAIMERSYVSKVVVNGVEIAEGSGWDYETDPYTFEVQGDHIVFNTAPSAPAAGGADNVFITFVYPIFNYTKRITRCRSAALWGINGMSDRIIAAGNPDFRNEDYICGYNDPTYWPDLSRQEVGSDESSIIGFRRIGDQLAIIKEDNGQGSSVFLRSGHLDENGEALWSTFACISGVGGVSRNGFGNIGDDQLILSSDGVYALTTNSLTSERITQKRSWRIDPRLVKEDLSRAKCVSFNNSLYIFIDGRVYILNGNMDKVYKRSNSYDYGYCCFYWEGFNFTSYLVTKNNGNESLWFGDDAGGIYKLNSDMETMDRFSDEDANGVKHAISCVWATLSDDDGDPMVYKTLLKKGNAVTIKPWSRSSVKICLRTDKDAVDWEVNHSDFDIFNWEDIDFSRFTFNSNDGPAEAPINRKVKNYKRLQILARNDNINEGFGIYAIVKHYVTGNFAKM